MKSNKHAGQFNLKGKKDKLLDCKCCIIQDFRQKEKDKQVVKELRRFWYKNIDS